MFFSKEKGFSVAKLSKPLTPYKHIISKVFKMIISNDKPCKQISLLPLFAWADAKREENINKNYAIIYLRSQYGFSHSRANLIAELQNYSTSNKWGL